MYVPYTTLQRLLHIDYLHFITVSATQAGDATSVVEQIAPLLRKRHGLESGAAQAQRSGLGGNQMPQSGTGGMVADDFTVKTQAAEALTKGLYTSVAAFVLANMPKVDQINLQEMAGTLNRAGATHDCSAGFDCRNLADGGRHRDHEHHDGVGDRAHARNRNPPRGGGEETRCAPAISCRGRYAESVRRRDRDRAGVSHVAAGDRDFRMADVGAGVGDCARVRNLRGGRRVFRILPGTTGV